MALVPRAFSALSYFRYGSPALEMEGFAACHYKLDTSVRSCFPNMLVYAPVSLVNTVGISIKIPFL